MIDACQRGDIPDIKQVVSDLVSVSALIGQTHCMLSDKQQHQLKYTLSYQYQRCLFTGNSHRHPSLGSRLAKTSKRVKKRQRLCQANEWSGQFEAAFQWSFFRPSPTVGSLPTSPTFWDKPRQWSQTVSPSCQEQPRLCTAGAVSGPQQPQTEGQQEPSSIAAQWPAVIQKLQTTKDKVGLFSQLFPQLLTYFTERASCFRAGQLSQHLSAWQQITSDPAILELVQGAKTEFAEWPTQDPVHLRFSAQEHDVISTEIAELVKKGVLKPSAHEHD